MRYGTVAPSSREACAGGAASEERPGGEAAMRSGRDGVGDAAEPDGVPVSGAAKTPTTVVRRGAAGVRADLLRTRRGARQPSTRHTPSAAWREWTVVEPRSICRPVSLERVTPKGT